MKRLRKHSFAIFQFGLLVLVFVVMAFVTSACEEEDGGPTDPSCGSGQLTWDSKAGVCRDDANGSIVPSSCCGQ
ncbi:MAG: hypothetical protein L0Y80_06240 [Ignavibacteriae bacterium]|nr:hypothetical protein [Ignavibacteriota bacterium]